MFELFTQQPVILASGSAIRKKLLERTGIRFTTVPSSCDEHVIKSQSMNQSIIELGQLLAVTKALEVSAKYPEHYVIGADQLCVLEATLFDKPMTHQKATLQLHTLQNRWHQQIACVCVVKNNSILWEYNDAATLHMRALSTHCIENYLRLEQPYQSCGSYQFEHHGKWLFKQVKGHEDTILGLPLIPLLNALIELNAVNLK